MNGLELAIAAAVDPVLDEFVRLERRLEEIAALPRPEPGAPGPAGAGLEAPAWAPGVYREGAIVTHYLGQYFKAGQDTAEEPGDSGHWVRLGFAGIRWRGALEEGMELRPGDQYIQESSLFLVDHTGQPRLINYRGERGPRGKEGYPGKAGAGLEDVIAGTDSLVFNLGDKGERELELRPILERLIEEIFLKQVLPTIREIGNRLVALERGRP
jgi:hypothetical protein